MIFLSFGMGIGLLSLFIIIPFFSMINKFSELEDITKLEKPTLLYSISVWPAIWLLLLILSITTVIKLFPEYKLGYFFGLAIAFVYVALEVMNLDPNKESKIVNSLKKSFNDPQISPDEEPDCSKNQNGTYPRFSTKKMALANWSTDTLEADNYKNLPWECTNCQKKILIEEGEVILKGNKNRYIVECNKCSEPSIIRVIGHALSGYSIMTEARLPEYTSPPPKKN